MVEPVRLNWTVWVKALTHQFVQCPNGGSNATSKHFNCTGAASHREPGLAAVSPVGLLLWQHLDIIVWRVRWHHHVIHTDRLWTHTGGKEAEASDCLCSEKTEENSFSVTHWTEMRGTNMNLDELHILCETSLICGFIYCMVSCSNTN